MPELADHPPEVLEFAHSAGFAQCLDDITSATSRLFPGDVRLETWSDPSEPQFNYLAVQVEFVGDPRQAVQHEVDWIKTMRAECPEAFPYLSLSW